MNRFITEPGARAHSRGVTLLELMAVVVIVGILGTIAVNSYRGYLMRTNRTDARMVLLRVQAAQEKFFLQNNQYSSTIAGLGVPATSPGGHYTITLARPSTTTYTATATATGGQTKDATACLTLTINETGNRTPTGNECWR